jgi:hypothetical protein
MARRSPSKICQLEHPGGEPDPARIGFSLAEAKDVLHRLRRFVVATLAEELCMQRHSGEGCHPFFDLKTDGSARLIFLEVTVVSDEFHARPGHYPRAFSAATLFDHSLAIAIPTDDKSALSYACHPDSLKSPRHQ